MRKLVVIDSCSKLFCNVDCIVEHHSVGDEYIHIYHVKAKSLLIMPGASFFDITLDGIRDTVYIASSCSGMSFKLVSKVFTKEILHAN